MTVKLSAIAPRDVLRASINLGNQALAREEKGELRGLAPALARRLADEIKKPIEFVTYESAGKSFKGASEGMWDVGFLAIDTERAKTVSFTRPYKEIVATYATWDNSPLQDADDVDRPGLKIVVARGSAYDLYLKKHLRHAELIVSDSPAHSMALFRSGLGDVVGGVMENLQRAFPEGCGIRILSGQIATVRQAMVLPYHDADRIAALDDFLAKVVSDKFISDNI
ncbi:transporter substrate-binding domain-containing protein [Agrobacterium vitis]|uniref:transporter substrate-binding domain-containing protein n=1 Tax=Agrobacterium vitis TaxID=373 RepID=UPI0012E7CC5D|nr:transporter substrate-binding domain-containing protein [Agrobacterium vitis]MVA12145.1 transporter substrate-binding domain-containing protein [Agrobacterium vitis]